MRDSEEVREKLICQVNLMKVQIVDQMRKLQERAMEAADIEIDFKAKMVAEELNLSTRKTKNRDSSLRKDESMREEEALPNKG